MKTPKSQHSLSSSNGRIRPAALLTLTFFLLNTLGSDWALAADALIPGGSNSSQVSGTAKTPDAVLGATGDWVVGSADKSETDPLVLSGLVKKTDLLGNSTYTDKLGRKKAEVRKDGSRTTFDYFGDTTKFKSSWSYDAAGKQVSGLEVYESGNIKALRYSNYGGVATFDDIRTTYEGNGWYRGRQNGFLYDDGSRYEHSFDGTSLQIKETRTFDKSGIQTNVSRYTYFGTSTRIQGQWTYDMAGKFISGLEIYESNNLKWIKYANQNVNHYTDEKLVYVGNGYSNGRILKSVTAEGVTVAQYEYDESTQLLIRTSSYDAAGKYTGEGVYEYWPGTKTVKEYRGYNAYGLLTFKETRYESNNIESVYYQSLGRTWYFSNDKVRNYDGGWHGYTTRMVWDWGGEEFYEYDGGGNMIRETIYRSGALAGVNIYEYHKGTSVRKSLLSMDAAGNVVEAFNFYPSGLLKDYTFRGMKTEYTDENVTYSGGRGIFQGNVLKVTYASGDTDVYDYSAGPGRLTRKDEIRKGVITRSTVYEYAGASKTPSVKKTLNAQGAVTDVWTYFPSGRMETYWYGNHNGTTYYYADESAPGVPGGAKLLKIVFGSPIPSYGGAVQIDYTAHWPDGKSKTVQYSGKDGSVYKIESYDSSGSLVSTEFPLTQKVEAAPIAAAPIPAKAAAAEAPKTVVAKKDYEQSYTQNGVAYKYSYQYYPDSDVLKKVERYENGKLLTVTEYDERGALKSLTKAPEATTYAYKAASTGSTADLAPALEKITIKNGAETIEVLENLDQMGVKLYVYDAWRRATKTLFGSGRKIETSYLYNDLTAGASADAKLKENLFDENDLLVRSLQYNSKGTQVRYMTDEDGVVHDCFTTDCLQEDAGVNGIQELQTVRGASVAVIEADYDGAEHGEAVQDIIKTLAGADMKLFKTKDHYEVANAVRQAADKGYAVINLSLEFAFSSVADWALRTGQDLAMAVRGFKSLIQDAVDYARSKNAVVVVAAGNDDPELSMLAQLNGVVSVGATDLLGRHQAFSNEGAELSLVANGLQISAFTQTAKKIRLYTGTSFAAPIVSAVISKLAGYLQSVMGSGADSGMVIDALKSGADDLGAEGQDALYGAGRVNIAEAFKRLAAKLF